jgi:two-component system chemotaxis response regulator CheB
MPKMNGLELLDELRKFKIPAKVMMASTATSRGAKITLDALEKGALEFVRKPDNALDCKVETFQQDFLRILRGVVNAKLVAQAPAESGPRIKEITAKVSDIVRRTHTASPGKKVVAIASSTGGPRALGTVISGLPADLAAPVLIVQHMPKGFTSTLAERLNATSPIEVREAAEGEELRNGVVYLAQGGLHMTVSTNATKRVSIHYTQEPYREGVRPCANYMYESLMDSPFEEVLCVVMTGMGSDGTVGVTNLSDKKKVWVIAQNQESCVVYGMPKSIVDRGLSNQVVPLDQIAQEIILNVGVT